jgi:trehalose 6-phosphate synthase
VSVPAPTFDLVVAANRLPVDRVVDDQGNNTWQRSPGGLVTALESVMRDRDAAWVGWAGEPGPAPKPFLEDGMYLQPVGLSHLEIEEYYEGFSNDTLWPIYHDVIVPPTFHRAWWSTYRVVNHRFAQAVADVAAPGATIWVHDYQLQLVPAMVRAIRPDVRIGWFNHIPFPPVELFSQLPWRRALVEGLLGADYLGFQRVADAENFLRTCRRVLHMTTRGDTVTFRGVVDGSAGGEGARETERTVRASAIPISVDFHGLEALARTPEVIARAVEIRKSLGSPETLLLGVDRLDYTKGILQRLSALELLLERRANLRGRLTLVQIAEPSRHEEPKYRQIRIEVEQAVGRINGRFTEPDRGVPVRYMYRTLSLTRLLSYYMVADAALVTPLKDGMNLVAKEYVVCQAATHGSGVLVLSEFAGAFQELTRALSCNPFDEEGLSNRIEEALSMEEGERRSRMQAMGSYVREHDVFAWAASVLADADPGVGA